MITTVILIKDDATHKASIKDHYLDFLVTQGVPADTVTVLPLLYNTPVKVIAKTAKAYLDKLLTRIPIVATKLIIADANYFKFITGKQKVSDNYGATVRGKHPGYDRFECVYVPNYRSLFKQPENQALIEAGLRAISGNAATAVIRHADYCIRYGSDRDALDNLHRYPVLTCDIETNGLHLEAQLLSISFAWSKHEGIAINLRTTGVWYLKQFLKSYKGRLIFHFALFDCKILIRNLFMDHGTDYEGLMEGLQCFRRVDDTMLLTYIEKNATTHVPLGLKEAALEYVGNYAIEIEDASKYSVQELLTYNLIDCLGSFYLYEKYAHQLTSEPYVKIFQPSIYLLLKMMIVGLPLDSKRVEEVDNVLAAKIITLEAMIQQNPYVIQFNDILRADECAKANAKLKVKVKPLSDFDDVQFNPNSGPQLIKLLFEMLKLPILDRTKTGAPTTGADTLNDLKNHTTDTDIIDLLSAVQDLADVTKIKNTFIRPFLREPGWVHGNLKLGGTQSGRLSSDNPNLTNLPAHGPMGKLIKSCVVAPEGWLFCGADFSALEERIGAILSKDPNRIKVYTDGYDGHSMRAHRYFGAEMDDINKQLAAAETATKFWIDDNGEYQCA